MDTNTKGESGVIAEKPTSSTSIGSDEKTKQIVKAVDSSEKKEELSPHLKNDKPQSLRCELGKRKVGSGGLASLVGTLGAQKKAKKQSVLDKSAQDWRQFVEQEDLEEELSSHMRSRESYLDKQEFLLNADYKQFEKERDLRTIERKSQQSSSKPN